MDDPLSELSTAFWWLGDGAVAYATKWFRDLRRKPVRPDPKETISPGDNPG